MINILINSEDKNTSVKFTQKKKKAKNEAIKS